MNEARDNAVEAHREGGREPGLVPFPRVFAVLGYGVFCSLLIAALAEGLARVAWVCYWNFRSPLHWTGSESELSMRRRRGLNGRWLSGDGDPWDTASASPAYDAYPWAEEFWEEERARSAWEKKSVFPYEPFRHWGLVKWNGRFINVDRTEMGLLRRTVNGTSPGCKPSSIRKIWCFGGSTTWGWIVPDFATIPSYLSTKLNNPSGGCVEVLNFGVPAYVTNQELIYLTQLLRAGHHPDVVIFYDGVNEALVGAHAPADAAAHFNFAVTKGKAQSRIMGWADLVEESYFVNIMMRLRDLSRRRVEGDLPATVWDKRALETLINYESNVLLAEALAKEYHFEVRFFWQPTLFYGKKRLTPFEQAIGENQRVEKAIRVVYQEAERRLAEPGKVVWLAPTFDAVEDTIYTDFLHLGPRGNELIAEAMAAILNPVLRGSSPPAQSPASP